MRFELALIVGILFFCSWCAYIVARMNSSVNVGTSAAGASTGANAGASSSLSPFASLSSQADFTASAGDLSRTVNSSGAGSLIGHANMQQSRLFGASEPIPSAQFTPASTPNGIYSAAAGRNWAPYASSGVDSAAGNYPSHAAAASVAQQQQQWQSYALPSHAHTAAAAGAPEPAAAAAYASQPLLLEYNNNNNGEQPAAASEDDENEEGEGPEDEGGVADYPQTAAASGEEPVEGEEEEEQAAADDEQSMPTAPTQTELEEVANRRSFDELQSDSSERDKDGRVVVTKRRHLINGRPVAVQSQRSNRGDADDDANQDREGQTDDDDDEHERAAASSRVPHEAAPSELDFEKLVDEIDEEDKLRKRQGAKSEASPSGTGAVSAAQSRQHSTRQPAAEAGPQSIGRRSDPDTPPPGSQEAGTLPSPVVAEGGQQAAAGKKIVPAGSARPSKNKAKDSHEHSLQESLTAQQWDDDSATSGGGAAAIAPETAPEIVDDEDQEQVANIVERDREAQRLARMSRDILLSPEQVSRELDHAVEAAEEGEERRRRRKRETLIRSSVPSNSSLRNPQAGTVPLLKSAATNEMTSRSPEPARDLSRERIRDTGTPEVPNGTTTTILPRADRRQTGGAIGTEVAASLARVGGGPNEQMLANATSPPEAKTHAQQNYLSETNDTARRVIHQATNDQRRPADTGGAGRNHHLRGSENNAPSEHTQLSELEDMHIEVLADPPPPAVGFAATPTSIVGGTPLSGHAHLSNPQVASASHKVKTKKSEVVKKKKKKKFKKASKSKMVDSKYKAARAYARKHASRHKKGQMRKKRRKSEKDLVAQRKRFKGATQGNKFARGQGAHGAKKGANFYKDKGYKKRGFKKAYHKLETGDHKTYFDEFRDKDHHKKWKNFDDRHKYAQKKHWAGSDSKHLDRHKLKLAKARATKAGKWRESAANNHMNELDKYKKYKKSSSKSKAVKSSAAKKRKKKKKKVE